MESKLLERPKDVPKALNRRQAVIALGWVPERPSFVSAVNMLGNMKEISADDMKFFVSLFKEGGFFELNLELKRFSADTWEEVIEAARSVFWILSENNEREALASFTETCFAYMSKVLSKHKHWSSHDPDKKERLRRAKAKLVHVAMVRFLLQRYLEENEIFWSSSRVFKLLVTEALQISPKERDQVFQTLICHFTDGINNRRLYRDGLQVDSREWFRLRLLFIALMDDCPQSFSSEFKKYLGRLLGILQECKYVHHKFSFVDERAFEVVGAKEFLATVEVVLNEIHMWLCSRPAKLKHSLWKMV